MALTQVDLDKAGCGEPNCTHDHSVLFLHGRCHPRAGVEAAYHKATGLLVLCCRTCKREIAMIEVAA